MHIHQIMDRNNQMLYFYERLVDDLNVPENSYVYIVCCTYAKAANFLC